MKSMFVNTNSVTERVNSCISIVYFRNDVANQEQYVYTVRHIKTCTLLVFNHG